MADDTEQQPIRQPPRREISRRPVVVGLIGLAVVEAVAGGITWKVLSQGLHKIALVFAPPVPTSISPGTTLYTYRGHSGGVNAVKWSPDGKRIVSGSDDQTVQVWDPTTGRRALIYRSQTGRVLTVTCSPDGKHIASAGSTSPSALPPVVTGLVPTSGPPAGGTTVTINGSGFTGATGVSFGSTAATIVNVESDSQLTATSPAGNGTVDVTVTTPNGTSQTSSADLFTYTLPPSPVVSSLDPFTYASPPPIPIDTPVPTPLPAPILPFVEVWDATTGKTVLIYKGHTKAVNSVAWSPDRTRIASGSSDKTVQVWDATTGRTTLTYGEHADAIPSVVWSPDGKYIASGSSDATVRVWDATTGRAILIYKGHVSAVNSVAWSPDGMRIASAGRDTTVQVWKAI